MLGRMYEHITLKLPAGFDLHLTVLNAAFDLPTRFYQKSRPDNQTTFKAPTYDRALGLHLAFAGASTAENKFSTFDVAIVDNAFCDYRIARIEFT